jgi:hypothetical protein
MHTRRACFCVSLTASVSAWGHLQSAANAVAPDPRAVSILIECWVRRRHPHRYQKVARSFFLTRCARDEHFAQAAPLLLLLRLSAVGRQWRRRSICRHKEHFIAVCCIDLNIRGLISSPPCSCCVV